MPLVAELTAPALFVAGATTSLHCALMCGAVNAAQVRSHGPVPVRQALALVHAGRVLGYALLGLLAGALGAQLALWLPDTLPGRALQALASAVLLAAGIQHWREPRRRAPSAGCGARAPAGPRLSPRVRLLAQGMAWALMPCGILYTVLLLAALTARPASGFILLAAFGLGTVPLMGASGGLIGLAARRGHGPAMRHGAAAALVSLGLAGLVLAALHPGVVAGWLCAG